MNYDCVNILKWTEAQLKYTYDVSLKEATAQELHEALSHAVMMAISDNWNLSKRTRMPKRKAYYISAEFLIGRLVYSNLYNLGILDEMKKLFEEHGDHVFDNYMNSIEIKAYCRDAVRQGKDYKG